MRANARRATLADLTADASAWNVWRPAEYLREYCRRVEADDEAALRFQVASGETGADDWSAFTEYVLRCEGRRPSSDLVQSREEATRRVLSDLLMTDARQRHPLGRERAASYDLLISGFCLDCLSQSKAIWRRAMRNVFGLLKPRGSFVLFALRRSRAYRVGTSWFPAADVSRRDMESALFACGADPSSLDSREHELPGHAGQGYRGMLLASGEVTA